MATITPSELINRFEKMAKGTPQATMAGAVVGGRIMEEAVAVASGKYAGRPIVRTKATRYPNGIGVIRGPSVQVKMTSRKAHLLDHDNKPHEIKPGALTGRRKKSPWLANKTTGFFSAIPVNHPGTKGKFMWELGLVAARPRIASAMNSAIGEQLLKVFR